MQLNYSLSGHDLFLLVSFYGFLSLLVLEKLATSVMILKFKTVLMAML